jgi:hypothetical protein
MSYSFQEPMCGGKSNTYAVTQEIIDLAERFREEVESFHGSQLEKYEVSSHISQVVSGMNYKIKIEVADDVTYEITIYQGYNQEPEFTNIELVLSESICG